MNIILFTALLVPLIVIPFLGLSAYMIALIIKALKKYLRSADVRKEKTEL